MSKLTDLTGKRYGRLVVLERAGDFVSKGGNKSTAWKCQCDCGNIVNVRGGNLKSGRANSCGCYSREIHSTQNGLYGSRLYIIWRSMKSRCYREKDINYKNYGARGITVCEEWKENFQAFYEWSMSHGYSDELSIDRIENDKGYFPENCRWATDEEQKNNMRSNHQLEFNGEKLTIAQWARKIGVNTKTIKRRLDDGWSIERTLTTKDGRGKKE